MSHEFPKGFLWGGATSAAQVEGGLRKAGAGLPIWTICSTGPHLSGRDAV